MIALVHYFYVKTEMIANFHLVTYFLRNTQTLRAKKSIILRVRNAKFSGYFFISRQKHMERFSNLYYCTFKVASHLEIRRDKER